MGCIVQTQSMGCIVQTSSVGNVAMQSNEASCQMRGQVGRPWVTHQRLDGVHSTGLRSEPTTEQRAFVGHAVPNGVKVQLDELRGDGFAFVRTNADSCIEGFLQAKHLRAEDLEGIAVPTIYCGDWDDVVLEDGFRALSDGFRFSLTAGCPADLIKIRENFRAMCEEKGPVNVHLAGNEDPHGGEQSESKPEGNEDPHGSEQSESDFGPEVAMNKITEIGSYTAKEVLDCIQKYQSREVGGRYAGYGVDEEVVRKLELTKPVVEAAGGPVASSGITGFHWELEVSYYDTKMSLGDVFLLDGHLLWIEFAIFDQ